MIETRECECFVPEARFGIGRVRHPSRKHLQRDIALEMQVVRAIHHPHPAFVESLDDAKMRKDLPRNEFGAETSSQ